MTQIAPPRPRPIVVTKVTKRSARDKGKDEDEEDNQDPPAPPAAPPKLPDPPPPPGSPPANDVDKRVDGNGNGEEESPIEVVKITSNFLNKERIA